MNSDYVRNIRFKLQTRINELSQTQDLNSFYFSLKRFWDYIGTNPIIEEIVNGLANSFPDLEQQVSNISPEHGVYGLNVAEQAALSYFVIKTALESNPSRILNLAFPYGRKKTAYEAIDSFRVAFLNPFYDYIDEQLHDQEFPLSFLLHYKQKCEWFQRHDLYNQWEKERKTGESLLKRHLFEYFHDQGFNILAKEPASPSGEVDLIAVYSNELPIILEAKVFSEGAKSKHHIVTGFKQVYSYVEDYVSPSGILLIYKTCGFDLKIDVPDSRQTIPCVSYNNKLILLLVVDIFLYEKTASKRGPVKAVVITEKDLVQELEG